MSQAKDGDLVPVPMTSTTSRVEVDLEKKTDETEIIENVENVNIIDMLKDEQLSPWTRSSFQLFVALGVSLCCSFSNGFDSSLLSGLLPMPYFQEEFGMGTTGSTVGAVACLFTIGNLFGGPIGAYVSDRHGRRWCMFVGSAMCIVGVAIGAIGKHLAAFAMGRFIVGTGTTVTMTSGPAYVMEISPPQWRGRFTGFYNCGWFMGNLPAAAITYGCNFIQSHASWRIPVLLQAAAAVVVCCGIFFIPESPRYMMLNGQEKEALDFLVKYHGNGNPDSKLVKLEYAEFKAGILNKRSDEKWWDYRILVDSKNHRWRSLQVLMMSIAGQYSGNGLAYFNVVIYENLGIETVSEQLAYNLIWSSVAAFGAMCGALMTDRQPRRMILTWGTLACACILAINAGLQSDMNRGGGYVAPEAVSKGALAAWTIFGAVFMYTYTPLQAVVPAEALETSMRAKGLALNSILTGLMGFLNQFAGPIALGNIGYKYVYVFVAWDTIEAGAWYLLGVEAKGRTLEELEWVYDQKNPVKASKLKSNPIRDPEQ